MSTSILCLAVVFAAPSATPEHPSVYALNRPFETRVRFADPHGQPARREGVTVRGQSLGYDEMPGTTIGPVVQGNAPQTYVTPPNAVSNGPLIVPGPVVPGQGDPFLPRQSTDPYRMNGPQPYQLHRWVSRYDVGFLPKSSARPGLGSLGVFETNAEWEYAAPIFMNWIFSFTQEFNYRAWTGPSTSAVRPTTALPGSVYRLGWDLELATPANYAWSALFAFNPSINSDFDRSLSRNAWNFDARGMLFFRQTPQWTWVLGAGFWDRVKDRVIPYAGFIYVPDPRWEWRILFPESRISYYLGDPYGFKTWLYTRGEFHSEAYEYRQEITGMREQVQLDDWRILIGYRFDNGWVSSFIEAGWVFGRDVDFRSVTPGFRVSSGFIGRFGVRF